MFIFNFYIELYDILDTILTYNFVMHELMIIFNILMLFLFTFILMKYYFYQSDI